MNAPPTREVRPLGRETERADGGADNGCGASQIVPQPADVGHERREPFQVMPALTADELDALRADIAERGIVVPVVVDQHGRTLDGHHRQQIAAELGIDCPTEVRTVTDDEDARQVALALNLTRRHLTREQRRELIAAEVEARPDDSDRAIARRLGCSPSTVSAVRARTPRVSKLDTEPMSAEEARAVIDHIDEAMLKLYAITLHNARIDRAQAIRVIYEDLEAAMQIVDDVEVADTMRRIIIPGLVRFAAEVEVAQ